VLDLLHLPAHPKADPPEDRYKGREEEDEHSLEDADDREERCLRGPGDRSVVVENCHDAGPVPHGDRCVGA
jgi:hypothetical protein